MARSLQPAGKQPAHAAARRPAHTNARHAHAGHNHTQTHAQNHAVAARATKVAAGILFASAIGAAHALPALADDGASTMPLVNPIDALVGDFTVFAYGNMDLNNAETEGSLAVLGDLTLSKGYAVIHSSGLTPKEYALPQIDGDPTRLLVGGQFDVTHSVGVSEVSSRSNETADQLGFVKLGDISNLAINERGNGGVWLSAAGTTSGTEPAIFVSEAVKQPQSAVKLTQPATTYFAHDLSAAQAVSKQLASTEFSESAHVAAVQLTAGRHGGERSLDLVQGETNVLTLDASSDFAINLTGAQPSATTVLVVNVLVGDEKPFTLPTFANVTSPNAQNPNTVAPYVLYNIVPAAGVNPTITGTLISGTILAPNGTLRTSATSPIEGQIIGNNLRTDGGENHNYKFLGIVPVEVPTDGGSDEGDPSGDPSTEPGETTDPGDGGDPGETTDPGDGGDPSDGSDPTDGGSDEGDPSGDPSTEPGETTDPGDGGDPSDGSSDPDDSTSPDDSTNPNDSVDPSDTTSPNTPDSSKNTGNENESGTESDSQAQDGNLAQTGTNAALFIAMAALLIAAGGSLVSWRTRRN